MIKCIFILFILPLSSWQMKLKVQGKITLEGQVSKFMKRLQEGYMNSKSRAVEDLIKGIEKEESMENVFRNLKENDEPVNNQNREADGSKEPNQGEQHEDIINERGQDVSELKSRHNSTNKKHHHNELQTLEYHDDDIHKSSNEPVQNQTSINEYHREDNRDLNDPTTDERSMQLIHKVTNNEPDSKELKLTKQNHDSTGNSYERDVIVPIRKVSNNKSDNNDPPVYQRHHDDTDNKEHDSIRRKHKLQQEFNDKPDKQASRDGTQNHKQTRKPRKKHQKDKTRKEKNAAREKKRSEEIHTNKSNQAKPRHNKIKNDELSLNKQNHDPNHNVQKTDFYKHDDDRNVNDESENQLQLKNTNVEKKQDSNEPIYDVKINKKPPHNKLDDENEQEPQKSYHVQSHRNKTHTKTRKHKPHKRNSNKILQKSRSDLPKILELTLNGGDSNSLDIETYQKKSRDIKKSNNTEIQHNKPRNNAYRSKPRDEKPDQGYESNTHESRPNKSYNALSLHNDPNHIVPKVKLDIEDNEYETKALALANALSASSEQQSTEEFKGKENNEEEKKKNQINKNNQTYYLKHLLKDLKEIFTQK